jgi:hypothetical protein
MGVAVGGPIGAAIGGLALGVSTIAGILGYIANDPADPNFTEIFQPVKGRPGIFVPEDRSFVINDRARGALNQIHVLVRDIWAFGWAAYVSGNRAQGARDRLDLDWEGRQIQQARFYLRQVGYLLRALRGQIKAVHDNTMHSLLMETNPDRNNSKLIWFQEQLLMDTELSRMFATYLSRVGLNAEQMEFVRDMLLAQWYPLTPQDGFRSLPPGYRAPAIPSTVYPDMLMTAVSDLRAVTREFRNAT